QAAITNRNHKEMEWSLWYARMRQSVPSARPADAKYWHAVEAELLEILVPPAPINYPTRKKRSNRGLGLSPLPGESVDSQPNSPQIEDEHE
ncbi:MAG: hypothetical protein ACRYFU_00275, partial [Janthinobacterium lividum]